MNEGKINNFFSEYFNKNQKIPSLKAQPLTKDPESSHKQKTTFYAKNIKTVYESFFKKKFLRSFLIKIENENLLSKYNPNKNKAIFKDFIIALIENRAQEIGLAIYNIQNGCFLISQVLLIILFIFILFRFLIR